MSDQHPFLETVKSGDHQESLKAIRDLLAERLIEATTRDSAAVAKQLVAVLTELDQLGTTEEESLLDELRDDRESDS